MGACLLKSLSPYIYAQSHLQVTGPRQGMHLLSSGKG